MFDVIIVGGGMAGGSAAMYTAYAGLKTIVFDTETSQLFETEVIQNYPGIPLVSGRQLWQTVQKQALHFGAVWSNARVTSLSKTDQGYRVTTEKGKTFDGKYVLLGTNRGTELLESLGWELEVNEHVPSRKIKQVKGVTFDGRTPLENVYIIGLNTGIPSQAIIASGQAVYVAVHIISKERGKPFMWHDVKAEKVNV